MDSRKMNVLPMANFKVFQLKIEYDMDIFTCENIQMFSPNELIYSNTHVYSAPLLVI